MFPKPKSKNNVMNVLLDCLVCNWNKWKKVLWVSSLEFTFVFFRFIMFCIVDLSNLDWTFVTWQSSCNFSWWVRLCCWRSWSLHRNKANSTTFHSPLFKTWVCNSRCLNFPDNSWGRCELIESVHFEQVNLP